MVLNLLQCPTKTFLYTIRPYDTLWLLAERFHTTIYVIASLNPGLDLNNLHIGQIIFICPDQKYSYPSSNHTSIEISKTEADLNNYLRMLWEQHVVWTRLTIISMVFDLPDKDVVTNRLLRNPNDFELALKPFYGSKTASSFANLLKNHLIIASQLVKAAKAGDNKAATDAEKRWYTNANEISAFLSSINPYWSQEDWREMLYEHLKLTKSEAVGMLRNNYSDGISIFDNIEKQALKMADVMTKGIVKQFSNSFTK